MQSNKTAGSNVLTLMCIMRSDHSEMPDTRMLVESRGIISTVFLKADSSKGSICMI